MLEDCSQLLTLSDSLKIFTSVSQGPAHISHFPQTTREIFECKGVPKIGSQSVLLPGSRQRSIAAYRRLSPCRGSKNWCAPGTTRYRLPIFGTRRVQSGRERSERTKEQCLFSLARESIRQAARVGDVHVPLAPVHGDGFEMNKF